MNTLQSPGLDPSRSAAAPGHAGPSAAALRMGYCGLLPFACGALLVWLVQPGAHPDEHGFVVLALSAYAAAIASFLGGIHWGLAMRQQPAAAPAQLAWGVVPSLVAWVALLMRADAALVVLGAMLLVCYAVDRRLYPGAGAAAWLTLRFRLSAVAALCCFVGAAGS